MRARRRTIAALGAAAVVGLAAALRAQDEADEGALRRENGALIMRLVARRTAAPAERALYRVDVTREGTPVDRTRRFEVTVSRPPGPRALRLRFREPPAFRGEAWLVRWGEGGARAWRYDPARRRVERASPLEATWRVPGTGVLLEDLLGEDPAAHVYAYQDEGTLEPPGGGPARPVHRVVARPRQGAAGAVQGAAWRLLHVDRDRHVPLRVDAFDAGGARTRIAWHGEYAAVGEVWRPFATTLEEPAQGRVSQVRLEELELVAPAVHLDPERFWQ